jgi:hypothetical protein
VRKFNVGDKVTLVPNRNLMIAYGLEEEYDTNPCRVYEILEMPDLVSGPWYLLDDKFGLAYHEETLILHQEHAPVL